MKNVKITAECKQTDGGVQVTHIDIRHRHRKPIAVGFVDPCVSKLIHISFFNPDIKPLKQATDEVINSAKQVFNCVSGVTTIIQHFRGGKVQAVVTRHGQCLSVSDLRLAATGGELSHGK